MKREGWLFDRVADFDALRRAAHQAMRGKKKSPRAARFWFDLEYELIDLVRELGNRTYSPRPYRTFVVTDPKQRRICAADFRDRVVHHAVCAVLEPLFERSFISDSYACRKGKGSHLALDRARLFSRQYRYFLKLDIRHFFDTIDHEVLKAFLRRKLKDPSLLWLLDLFIDHPVPWTEQGKGLPIGNLTSQLFANFYLDPLDHYLKEDLGLHAYVRYMDDLLLFGEDKNELWEVYSAIAYFLSTRLHLCLKPQATRMAPVDEGISFLGFTVYPGLLRLQRKGWNRCVRKLHSKEGQHAAGLITEEALVRSAVSLVGHLRQAASRNVRSKHSCLAVYDPACC